MGLAESAGGTAPRPKDPPSSGPSQPPIPLPANTRGWVSPGSGGELAGEGTEVSTACSREMRRVGWAWAPQSFDRGSTCSEPFKGRACVTVLGPRCELSLPGESSFSIMTKVYVQVSNRYGDKDNHESTGPAPYSR